MRKLAVSLLGLMLATSTVVACGGSSGKSGSSDTQPQVTTGDTGGDGSASDAFSQLVAQASTANIKITYAQSDGDSVTIAQDGNGKTAYQSGDSTFYTDGDTTVSCSGTGADAECTQIPGGGAIGTSILTVFTTLFSGLAKLDSSVYSGHESSETIAGRDAQCITFKASDFAGLAALGSGDISDPSAEATICVDKETGFLLKLSSKSNNSTKDEFLATKVEEPTSDDFTPPVTPKTIPIG